ncbi:T9SS type A sorting domain-containing protein [bacterium]|nr:T9SS type A sorting domain-containing protein [bacterium]
MLADGEPSNTITQGQTFGFECDCTPYNFFAWEIWNDQNGDSVLDREVDYPITILTVADNFVPRDGPGLDLDERPGYFRFLFPNIYISPIQYIMVIRENDDTVASFFNVLEGPSTGFSLSGTITLEDVEPPNTALSALSILHSFGFSTLDSMGNFSIDLPTGPMNLGITPLNIPPFYVGLHDISAFVDGHVSGFEILIGKGEAKVYGMVLTNLGDTLELYQINFREDPSDEKYRVQNPYNAFFQMGLDRGIYNVSIETETPGLLNREGIVLNLERGDSVEFLPVVYNANSEIYGKVFVPLDYPMITSLSIKARSASYGESKVFVDSTGAFTLPVYDEPGVVDTYSVAITPDSIQPGYGLLTPDAIIAFPGDSVFFHIERFTSGIKGNISLDSSPLPPYLVEFIDLGVWNYDHGIFFSASINADSSNYVIHCPEATYDVISDIIGDCPENLLAHIVYGIEVYDGYTEGVDIDIKSAHCRVNIVLDGVEPDSIYGLETFLFESDYNYYSYKTIPNYTNSTSLYLCSGNWHFNIPTFEFMCAAGDHYNFSISESDTFKEIILEYRIPDTIYVKYDSDSMRYIEPNNVELVKIDALTEEEISLELLPDTNFFYILVCEVTPTNYDFRYGGTHAYRYPDILENISIGSCPDTIELFINPANSAFHLYLDGFPSHLAPRESPIDVPMYGEDLGGHTWTATAHVYDWGFIPPTSLVEICDGFWTVVMPELPGGYIAEPIETTFYQEESDDWESRAHTLHINCTCTLTVHGVIEGYVVDDSGAALEPLPDDILYFIYLYTSADPSTIVHSGVIDTTGYFHFDVYEPGTYIIRFDPGQFRGNYLMPYESFEPITVTESDTISLEYTAYRCNSTITVHFTRDGGPPALNDTFMVFAEHETYGYTRFLAVGMEFAYLGVYRGSGTGEYYMTGLDLETAPIPEDCYLASFQFAPVLPGATFDVRIRTGEHLWGGIGGDVVEDIDDPDPLDITSIMTTLYFPGTDVPYRQQYIDEHGSYGFMYVEPFYTYNVGLEYTGTRRAFLYPYNFTADLEDTIITLPASYADNANATVIIHLDGVESDSVVRADYPITSSSTYMPFDTMVSVFNDHSLYDTLYLCDASWTITAPYIRRYRVEPEDTTIIIEEGATEKNISFTYTWVGIEDDKINIPERFCISQNYPNPFNLRTSISVGLPADGYIDMDLYNIKGEKVENLFAGPLTKGYHEIEVSLKSRLSSGLYFVKISNAQKSLYQKILLLK